MSLATGGQRKPAVNITLIYGHCLSWCGELCLHTYSAFYDTFNLSFWRPDEFKSHIIYSVLCTIYFVVWLFVTWVPNMQVYGVLSVLLCLRIYVYTMDQRETAFHPCTYARIDNKVDFDSNWSTVFTSPHSVSLLSCAEQVVCSCLFFFLLFSRNQLTWLLLELHVVVCSTKQQQPQVKTVYEI